MSKYLIVLFKNKVRKKIIKKYQTGKPAMNFFNNLISENEKVVFPREVENTVDSNYEVAVLEKNSQRLLPTYMTDEFGRNIKVKLENPDYNIPKVGVKVMSVLNNKVIIQNDDEVRLFSLKSENEAERFIAEISSLFYKNKRGDCLFVTDTSSPQRKYLFQFLESKGFDKKILYRKFTTHPRHLRPK